MSIEIPDPDFAKDVRKVPQSTKHLGNKPMAELGYMSNHSRRKPSELRRDSIEGRIHVLQPGLMDPYKKEVGRKLELY